MQGNILEIHLTADDDTVALACQFVQLLEAYRVNLVVNVCGSNGRSRRFVPLQNLHRHGRYFRVPNLRR